MAFNTKIKLTDQHVEQGPNTTLTLSGNTRYASHPNFTGATQLVDKQYVDMKASGASGTTIYNLTSPATTTVGGITAGYVLTGKSSNCLLKEILTPYQAPAFSSFSANQSTPLEVGTVLSGSRNFTFAFTNASNVLANSMCIRDVTASSTLATNCSTTSPLNTITITTKTLSSCGDTQVWCGSAKMNCSGNPSIGSAAYTVTGLLPYFYGVCTCPGPAGANRPTLTAAQITGGTKVIASSAGALNINFNSTSNDYLWFAFPDSVSAKVCWYVDAINNGAIGGGVSPACNLFPAATVVSSVQNVCWSGQSYKLYVSNKQTAQTLSIAIS